MHRTCGVIIMSSVSFGFPLEHITILLSLHSPPTLVLALPLSPNFWGENPLFLQHSGSTNTADFIEH